MGLCSTFLASVALSLIVFVRARYRYGRLSRTVSEAESVTAPAEEDIDKTADDVAATPLAPQRGALKKKSAAGTCLEEAKVPSAGKQVLWAHKIADREGQELCADVRRGEVALAGRVHKQSVREPRSVRDEGVPVPRGSQEREAPCGHDAEAEAHRRMRQHHASPRCELLAAPPKKKPTASSDSLDALAEQTDDDDWRDDADDRANDSDDAYAWLDA